MRTARLFPWWFAVLTADEALLFAVAGFLIVGGAR